MGLLFIRKNYFWEKYATLLQISIKQVSGNIMKGTILIIPFLAFSFFSCEKKISQEEFEQNVFDQVFLKIVDSTYKDKRLYTYPLPSGKEDDFEFQKKLQALEKDSLNLIVAVDNKRQMDYSRFNSNKFIFKNLSELPKDQEYENWSRKYEKFVGAMSFSKIHFDEKKENAEITVSYFCGVKCGLGYIVYLKKKNKNGLFQRLNKLGHHNVA